MEGQLILEVVHYTDETIEIMRGKFVVESRRKR
jgi:hypothetical protein